MSSSTSRRNSSRHASMFLRMLWRASTLRKARAAAALLAMIVAAATATAMLNLYVDMQAKLRQEFRSYGANIAVVGHNGQSLPADALQKVNIALDGRGLAVPFAYAVANTSDGKLVVVAGTDFPSARKLDSWWSVTGWPQASHTALLGARAAEVLVPDGKSFDLTFQQKAIHLISAGTLSTGAAEDSRVYLSLADFEKWTGVTPSTIEVGAYGTPEQVSGIAQKISVALPGVEVRPIRQIVEGEARVLGKTRSTVFASGVLIVITAALCVLATLMGWVYDRRRDFAIMKALGASERIITSFVAAESAALGAAGAILGFILGIGVAVWIGHANFHAAVTPRLNVFPPVLLGSIFVALLASLLPVSLLRRAQPANILKGE
jgi:putative ABC transport system permease protein